MTGIELLAASLELAPDARRVLLTAYADTDVAIRAINEIRLDQYLQKPWDPPEERLFPVLDDLLSDWRATFRPAVRGDPPRRPPLVGPGPRDQGLPRPQPRSLPLGGRRGRPGGAPPRGGRGDRPRARPPARLPGRVAPPRARPTPRSPRRSACGRGRTCGPTTSSSSAAARPASRRRSTARRRACARCSSSARRPAARRARRRGSRTTSASRRGCRGADLARRAVAQASRLGAELLTSREATALRLEDRYRLVTLDDGERDRLRRPDRGLGRPVPAARGRRDRPARGRRRLLRRRDHRGARHAGPARGRGRRRQLRRAGRGPPRRGSPPASCSSSAGTASRPGCPPTWWTSCARSRTSRSG